MNKFLLISAVSLMAATTSAFASDWDVKPVVCSAMTLDQAVKAHPGYVEGDADGNAQIEKAIVERDRKVSSLAKKFGVKARQMADYPSQAVFCTTDGRAYPLDDFIIKASDRAENNVLAQLRPTKDTK